ncbi:MAG TPA: hypothetical protein VFW35_11755, partial [Sphingomicrobium sp.]|nr:hypothetical protein [Sphingomicrobium sp.]
LDSVTLIRYTLGTMKNCESAPPARFDRAALPTRERRPIAFGSGEKIGKEADRRKVEIDPGSWKGAADA